MGDNLNKNNLNTEKLLEESLEQAKEEYDIVLQAYSDGKKLNFSEREIERLADQRIIEYRRRTGKTM